MALKRLLIAACAILACLMFAWATGAGRPYPASAGGVVDPTCTSSSPCIEYDNNGSGPGIRGISIGGNGLAGSTEFNSTSSTNFHEGLIGNDISGSGSFNAGVRGLSVRGTGVMGNSTSGAGISGTSTSGLGVSATSSTGTAVKAIAAGGGLGVDGESASGTGVYGFSLSSNGVLGQSYGTAVYGLADSAGSAVYADAASFGTGYGLEAHGFSNAAVYAEADGTADGVLVQGSLTAFEAHTGGASCTGARCVGVYATNSAGNGSDITGTYIGLLGRAPAGAFPLLLTDTGANDLFYVDGSGNVFYHGSLNSFAVTRTGSVATAYSAKTTSPAVEDTGSGQLINGVGVVALDSAFAQTIDPRTPYQVMLTPDGDTRGLFVASKGLNGFVVREVQGGRSSLMFDYHIYATALGHAGERMVVMNRAAAAAMLPKAPVVRPMSQPLTRRPVRGQKPRQ